MSEQQSLPGWGPRKPPPEGDSEPPPKRKRFWWRFLLGGLIIVVVAASATATGVLVYLDSVAKALSQNHRFGNKVENFLSTVEAGKPENILILGSDKRAGPEFEGERGRSDTTILLRLDPEKQAIAVMSIPRDLKTEIPGVGTTKFNAAYAEGGPRLTLRVVKEMTGLKINHVVNVDFLGFAQAVYAIGCVFTDVDRRYYHSNEGVPPSEQYAEIDIQPGYQLLCGKKALEYVRYRHTDTDIVRSARQQDFIAAARARISVGDIVKDVFIGGGEKDLIEIFTKYTRSDIDTKEKMLEVLKLFLSVRNVPIEEVHFPAELGESYVTASPEAIHEAVDRFMGIEASAGPRGTLEGTGEEEEERTRKGGKQGKKKAKPKPGKKKSKKKKNSLVEAAKPGSDELVPAREVGEAEAEAAVEEITGRFPVFYPTRLPPAATYVESNPFEDVVDPYVYRIKESIDKNSNRFEAYRMVAAADLPDGLHYFGVQGIHNWPDPPILAGPSEAVTIKGREFDIYYDGGRINLIAWHRGESSYWIANDLLKTFTNKQMIGMARSVRVIVPKYKRKRKQGVSE